MIEHSEMSASRLPRPVANFEAFEYFLRLNEFFCILNVSLRCQSCFHLKWLFGPRVESVNFVASIDSCKVCETICNWQWWQCTAPTLRGTGQLTEGAGGKKASEPVPRAIVVYPAPLCPPLVDIPVAF